MSAEVLVPDMWASEFFALKGALSLIATLLYLVHMNRVWSRLAQNRLTYLGVNDQQWRYLALLFGGIMVTFSSVEQITTDAGVYWRNVLALLFAVVLLVAAVVSLRHDRSV